MLVTGTCKYSLGPDADMFLGYGHRHPLLRPDVGGLSGMYEYLRRVIVTVLRHQSYGGLGTWSEQEHPS